MSTRSFTEAVPLSLSSMSHMSHELEEGVVDGLRQILQHTLLSCVNYARMTHRSREWSLHDLVTSEYAFTPCKGQQQPPKDLPWSLSRLGFKHQYARHTWIYFKPLLQKQAAITPEEEQEYLSPSGWCDKPYVLGRLSLLYASQELLTKEELDGTESEDVPPLVLYKIFVEYRSLPATGSAQAVQAEELSMLSFGGSVDDDVKLGALASLYDRIAKYVLEIYSVRGKKYKFDLMDSTLSDGTVPVLSSSRDGDPFAKSLCVTVTEHATTTSCAEQQQDKEKESTSSSTDGKSKFAITRMSLTLDGNLRQGKNSFDKLPKFDYVKEAIQKSFLFLHKPPPIMATGVPSGQTLLVEQKQAGKLYVNGRYVTTWGKDPKLGSHFPALFGMDLHSVVFWHGRIMDFEGLKTLYGQLWQEVLTDARLLHLELGKKLLYRLMNGKDPEADDDDDLNDEDDEDDDDDDGDEPKSDKNMPDPPDTSIECLESVVMQSKKYDPVGISAKALATRFAMEFGKNAFPCLTYEVDWVKDLLPGRKPVVVPQRLLNVLRRGGYFSVKMTFNELWFAESRPPKDGKEKDIVDAAVKNLEDAGCTDVKAPHIVFSPGNDVDDIVKSKAVCRYNETLRQYHFHEKFATADIPSKDTNGEAVKEEKNGEEVKAKAFVMGMYIAQKHPDGNVIVRYLLRNQK